MRRFITTLAITAMLAGCDGGNDDPDAAGTDGGDDVDAGPPRDGGGVDGGGVDGGGSDGGTDAGDYDAGPIGGGAATSEQIAAVRDAFDGPTALDVDGAIVTYLKPAVGADPAGFFVQAEQLGPALFVRADPTTTTPPLAVGDVVSFQVTAMATVAERREVTTITDLAVGTRGHNVSFLVQDVSAADDLTSNVGDYESELIRVTGTLASAWTPRGVGHEGAELDTAGLLGDMSLVVRLPSALRASLDASVNCVVRATGPMWRTGSEAQPSAYAMADVGVVSCERPWLLNAFAASSTSVVLQFERGIDMASITAPATQFAISGPGASALAVSAATVSGTDVILTTAAQVSGAMYIVTVANTVTDARGLGVDGAHDSDMFNGFAARATLVINEVNPTVAMQCDLIELRVTAGGNLDGYGLYWDETRLIHTFGAPGLAMVATGDIIVVHLSPNTLACSGRVSGDPLPVSETTAADEIDNPFYYATAYDVWGLNAAGGLNFNAVTLSLRDAAGNFVDVAAFHQVGTIPSFGAPDALEIARAMGEWTDPGVPYTVDNYEDFAVPGINTANNTATSPSLRRTSNADTNAAADWASGAQTFGVLNAGQT